MFKRNLLLLAFHMERIFNDWELLHVQTSFKYAHELQKLHNKN